jgi:hypothetical protein
VRGGVNVCALTVESDGKVAREAIEGMVSYICGKNSEALI